MGSLCSRPHSSGVVSLSETMTTREFQHVATSDLQHFCLGAQAFGAELHDRVGAEGVSDLVLTERAQPQRQRALQLQGRDKDGLVT